MRSLLLCFLTVCSGSGVIAADGESDPPISSSTAPSSTLAKQLRWRNYSQDAFLSPGAFFASVMPAVGEQRSNTPAEYGQGWDAFGDRVARRAAQYQVQTALFHGSAAALRTETVYRRCECTGGWRRLGYSLSRTFVTRTEGGRLLPNAPLLGGYVGGAMIATAWYPDRYRPDAEGLRAASFQLGGRTIVNIVREFAPELKRAFRLR